MGVTYGIHCSTCRMYGPLIGDCGFVGFPSLQGRRRRGYLTFGAIYRSLKAIGAINAEVAAIHGFLAAHDGHVLDMNGDGIDWEPSGLPDDGSEPFEYTGPTEQGRYVVTCSACSSSFESAWDAFVPFERRLLSPRAIKAALGLLPHLEDSHDRVAGFPFDDGDASSFCEFLEAHRTHALHARLDTEEPAEKVPDLPAVLEQVWSQPCPHSSRLAVRGRFTITHSQYGLRCFDSRTGSLAWSSDNDHDAGAMFVDDEALWTARRDPATPSAPATLMELDVSTGVEGRSFGHDLGPMSDSGDTILCGSWWNARRFDVTMLDRGGAPLWHVAESGFENRPQQGLIAGNAVVVFRGDSVECRGASDGALRWRRVFSEHGGLRSPASLSLKNQTILAPMGALLVALDIENGATRWERPSAVSGVLIDGGRAIVVGETLLVCEIATGEVRGEVAVNEEMSRLAHCPYRVVSRPLLCLGWIVLVDQAHRLWVFDPKTLRAVGWTQPRGTLPLAGDAIAVNDCVYSTTLSTDKPLPSVYCHRLLLPAH
jgi:outer membrane protein assembly factor BamB